MEIETLKSHIARRLEHARKRKTDCEYRLNAIIGEANQLMSGLSCYARDDINFWNGKATALEDLLDFIESHSDKDSIESHSDKDSIEFLRIST